MGLIVRGRTLAGWGAVVGAGGGEGGREELQIWGGEGSSYYTKMACVLMFTLYYKEALFSCPRNILVWALGGSSWFRIWSLTGVLPPAASITILSFSPVLA